jgi:hypothetical protein
MMARAVRDIAETLVAGRNRGPRSEHVQLVAVLPPTDQTSAFGITEGCSQWNRGGRLRQYWTQLTFNFPPLIRGRLMGEPARGQSNLGPNQIIHSELDAGAFDRARTPVPWAGLYPLPSSRLDSNVSGKSRRMGEVTRPVVPRCRARSVDYSICRAAR